MVVKQEAEPNICHKQFENKSFRVAVRARHQIIFIRIVLVFRAFGTEHE